MKDRTKHDDNRADDDRAPETAGGQASAVIIAMPAEQTGNNRTAAKAEDIAQGDHHGDDGSRQGNTGDHVGVAGVGDEKCVNHVVDHRHQHAEYNGQRKREINLGHRSPDEQFIIHGSSV